MPYPAGAEPGVPVKTGAVYICTEGYRLENRQKPVDSDVVEAISWT